MSEEHLGIESLPSTYEQAVELFRRVRDLKAGVVVEIEPTQSGDSLLLLRVEIPPENKDVFAHPVRAFRAHQSDLVRLAREILRTLDPVTNEQLLEKIENLVACQNTSELE